MTATTWPAMRAALTAVCAALLECDPSWVRWATDSQPVSDLQVRLSVVSEVSEADATREVQPDLSVTFYESKRLQIQVLIETSNGEYPENTEDAQALASRLRLALQHDVTIEALKSAGIALVQAPGPVQGADYEDRESTYWVCARSFELPIRVTFEYTDPDYSIGQMQQVIGSGDIPDPNDLTFDVENP